MIGNDMVNYNLNKNTNKYDLYLPSNFKKIVQKTNEDDIVFDRSDKITILNNAEILCKINKQLNDFASIDGSCPNGSSIKRIIISDELPMNIPHIMYQYKSLAFKFNCINCINL